MLEVPELLYLARVTLHDCSSSRMKVLLEVVMCFRFSEIVYCWIAKTFVQLLTMKNHPKVQSLILPYSKFYTP